MRCSKSTVNYISFISSAPSQTDEKKVIQPFLLVRTRILKMVQQNCSATVIKVQKSIAVYRKN